MNCGICFCSFRGSPMRPSRFARRICPWIVLAAFLAFCYDLIPSREPIFTVPTTLQSHLASYVHWAAREIPYSRTAKPSRLQQRSIPSNTSTKRLQEPRVAICLVGGARAFELTGPTINKYVLDVFSKGDVFVHAPLDKDTFKLFLLKAQNTSSTKFAVSRIFKPQHLQEEDYHKQVLTSSGSPHGIQGLLQYFNLVEGCWQMITKYELQHKFRYDWILRTRLDGYWNNPIPSIASLRDSYYTVPYGSQFGGLNDRLGIGDRNTSREALQRLRAITRLHKHGYSKLNSERAFKAQLRLTNTSFQLRKFPFCILSSRKYAWPPSEWGVPVMSISSRGPLNGAKCRPCTPQILGKQAKVIAEALNTGWSWTGPNEGVDLCDARGDWEPNWENVFDSVAEPEARDARVHVGKLTLSKCIESVRGFRELWDSWEGPAPEVICHEKRW